MKKLSIILVSLIVVVTACKKEGNENTLPTPEISGEKKHAKYRVTVSKDEGLTEWLATLDKAEEVELLEVKTAIVKKKETEIAKVRLIDESTGFVELKHLASTPVVFLNKTKAYERPSALVKVKAEINPGTIGFTVEQKDGWTQVYIGEITKGIWVTNEWVEDMNYTTDINFIIDAKKYESALNLLKESKNDEAIKVLEELQDDGETELFRSLAAAKIAELNGEPVPESDQQEEQQPEPME